MRTRLLQFSCLALFFNVATCSTNLNLTIAFSNDNENNTACAARGDAGKLSFTIFDIPTSYTCFNMSTLVSEYASNGGYKLAQWPAYLNGNVTRGSNVSYALNNINLFDSNANYSKLWFYQSNVTLNPSPGQVAQRRVFFYTLPDCEQLPVTGENRYNDTPWYETSCQTEEQGVCQTMPLGVRSFAVNEVSQNIVRANGCSTWAYLGASYKLAARPALVFVGMMVSLFFTI